MSYTSVISIILFSLLILLPVARTYDTGHHTDLTRNAMEIYGYQHYARDVGALMNWLVDYYSYTLQTEDIPELASLHHDNLYNIQNVSNYLTTIANNTRTAVQSACNNNDSLTFLSVMGASLHAIQDFYTHSLWVENHPSQCGCYRDDTWFSALYEVQGNISQLVPTLGTIRTYSWGEACREFERNCFPGQLEHGDYCGGINKDSYVRPMFEASYGFAFAASIEWIYNLEKWANETSNGSSVLENARNYAPANDEQRSDLARAVEASIEVSYATKTVFEDDGHWKGSGSGNLLRFASSALEFIASRSIYKRQYTDNKFYLQLVHPNPYDLHGDQEVSNALDIVTPYTQLPSELRSYIKVKVRTWQVDLPNAANTPSPYALVTIGNQTLEENVLHDQNSFFPHWTSIKFLPSTQQEVAIHYVLMNDKFPSSDEQISITNFTGGDLDVVLNLASNSLSGDETGVYSSRDQLLTVTAGRHTVSLYITTQQYGNCVLRGLPQAYCPDEAYTQLFLQDFCGVDRGADDSASSMLRPLSIFVIFLFLLVINN